jgi:hypothetical protein
MDGYQKVNAMLIFLDTEFTNLLHPELLSLGLVTLDGREHYGELDLTTRAGKARVIASSDFVRYGGVLALWGCVPGAVGTEWEIGRRAGEWLLGLAAESGTRIEVGFDYSMDYELLEYAIRDAGLWEQVREVVLPVNVNAITGTINGEMAAEACFRELSKRAGRGLQRHHALADALALRAAYMAVKGAALARAGASNADQSLYRLSDYPVLEKLARLRTTATHLDGRACRFIYQAALDELDIAQLSGSERQLFESLIIP